MPVCYRIAERYLLRGWEKLPCVAVDSLGGNVGFQLESMMDALLECNRNGGFGFSDDGPRRQAT